MRYLVHAIGWMTGIGLLVSGPVQAQVGDGVYAAPGHLITFPHRPPPPPPRPNAIVSPLLARFWHDQERGRERARNFYQFMSTNLKYPEPASKAGMIGHIYVRLTVGPNGSVNDAQVIRSQTASLLPTAPSSAELAAGTAALEAETLRIFRAARFSASKAKADTVTVSASFQIQ